jgi:hypothetical protein
MAAISSSVVEECRYFGKQGQYFLENRRMIGTAVKEHYFNSLFWSDILKKHFTINSIKPFGLPAKSGRLRENLGWQWGFNVFGTQQNVSDQKRQKLKRNLEMLSNIFHAVGLSAIYKKCQGFLYKFEEKLKLRN